MNSNKGILVKEFYKRIELLNVYSSINVYFTYL